MRFVIHPLFILTALVAFFFAVTDFFIALTIAVILHELAHALVAKKIGTIISCVTLSPFGGILKLESKVLSREQKRLIYLAGPVASLMFCLIFGVIVWLMPVFFVYFEYLVAANFFVGLMNLMPIYPLDGGKVLSLYLPVKYLSLWSNMIYFCILLFGLVTFRWWWICFAIIMIIQINWDFKQSLYHDKFSYAGKLKTGNFVRCAVVSSMSLWSVYRMINIKQPTEFVIIDHDNKTFYEKDLEQWLLSHPSNSLLGQCVK